jgi:hypothetical protein
MSGRTLPVTRLEIAEHVAGAFTGPAMTRDQLLAVARQDGARRAVLRVLAELPDGPFHEVRQLWPAIPDVPIEPDDAGS